VDEALAVAREAMALLEAQGPPWDGEGDTRLVHAEALALAGETATAREALADARARLLARAERIPDPAYRESFLERVPEHARTMTLVL
jgi:hypothetical protein